MRRAPERDGGEAAGRGPVDGVLKGLQILVVEDDFIVAFDMQTMLEDQGARVLGPASSLREAQEILAAQTPQAAVLDVNLNGEFVFPLVEQLRAKGVPFLFATAYSDDDQLFPLAAKQAPRLAKPVLPALLVTQLRKLLG